jgi:iron(III) transport system permease protein
MKGLFLLATATLAALAVLVALPIAFVVLQAVFPHLGEGSLRDAFGAWPAVFADPAVPDALAATIRLGSSVALAAATIGIPLGALRGLFRIPFGALWDLAFLVPFLLPPYITALSWTMALQPRGYLSQLAGVDLAGLLFSHAGLALVMGLNIFPVVYFAVSRAMAATGGRLADVARVFGATPARAFVRVTLPLALPAIAASLLLAFTLAIEEYGVPAALGSQSRIAVLTTAIEQRLADWPIDLPGSAVLSLVLVALALTGYALQRAAVAGRDVETTLGKPAPVTRASPGRWNIPILILFGAAAIVSALLPMASMLATALTRTVSGRLSAGNFTLAHYRALFAGGGDALYALGTSLALAAAAAGVTGFLGFLAAWCAVPGRLAGGRLIDALALLPAAMPGVVMGVGLILAWNQPFWPATPYGTWVILLMSYACLLLPYPVRYVGAALAQIGPNLEAAARVHGASAHAALARITLPLTLPSLAAAMLMVFAVASRELVTSLLLAPAGVQTVSIYVWTQFEQGSVGAGMAMATIAALASLMLMLAGLRLQRRMTGGT